MYSSFSSYALRNDEIRQVVSEFRSKRAKIAHLISLSIAKVRRSASQDFNEWMLLSKVLESPWLPDSPRPSSGSRVSYLDAAIGLSAMVFSTGLSIFVGVSFWLQRPPRPSVVVGLSVVSAGLVIGFVGRRLSN
uniref:Transmembrane protein n=1 Tax=Meloidogyne hapla TaxID=6305 RepID=A0A1I8BUY9_MELHA